MSLLRSIRRQREKDNPPTAPVRTYGPMAGRENVYTCEKCHGMITTIDRDEGVTPFMLMCRATEGCKGFSYSSMYPKGPRPPHIPAPTYEWYRPTPSQVAKMPPAHQEHFLKGGLDIRKISESAHES